MINLNDLPTTSKFTPTEIIFQRKTSLGVFVVCRGLEDHGPHADSSLSVAMRYHIRSDAEVLADYGIISQDGKRNLGYPNGMGKAQWFILPYFAEEQLIKLSNDIDIRFRGKYEERQVGDWIKLKGSAFRNDWACVTHIYGLGGENLSAIGLGKSDSFPVRADEVQDVKREESAFNQWHGQRSRLWYADGVFFVTYPKLDQKGQNVFQQVQLLPLINGSVVDTRLEFKFSQHATDLCYFYQLDKSILIHTFDTVDCWSEIKERAAAFNFKRLGQVEVKLFAEEAPSSALHETLFGPEQYFVLDISSTLDVPEPPPSADITA